jgi:hypothetical protein
VRAGLAERRVVTWPDLFGGVTEHLAGAKAPFDFAVVDEAQDVGVAELRFLLALGAGRRDGLFFAGDLGQRVFQQPFSWRSLGVDIRGRSHTLRINYRTSHQIRAQADKLLPSSVADVDGNAEDRRGTISVFNGPAPTIETFDDPDEEAEAVGGWIADRVGEGVESHEISVFVRSPAQLRRARIAVKRSGAAAGRADRQSRDDSGPRLDRHDPPGEGARIPRRRGYGLRRRGNPAATAYRSCRRRRRSGGGLQHRAAPALRRLHPRPRPPAGDRRQAGLRIPRRHAALTRI